MSEGQHLIQWKQLLGRALLFTFLMLIFYGITAYLFHEELKEAGIWLGENLGFFGVALYVYVVDAIIIPATADIVFPFTIGWNPVILLSVMSAASMAGGITGYWIARSFNKLTFVSRMTSGYRERGIKLIREYGAWAVVIAGLTPIPYSTVCWIAGLLNVPPNKVMVATLSRAPRIILYYFLFKGGFSLVDLLIR